MTKLLFTLLILQGCFWGNGQQFSHATSNIKPTSMTTNNLLESEKRRIQIYKNVVPAVVNVTNIKINKNPFFGLANKVPQGAGSGFVWNGEGHIVTNYHVVQGGDSFMVTFHNDKKQYKAKLVGVEPNKDIAVLKLTERPKNLTMVTPGQSKNLQVGQTAIAIGNPFGLDHSMSSGIISALGRSIMGVGEVKINDMIQTDTAINQGNSGGPLLNSSGQLIGMNTMIYSPSGASAGLGFAVPVDIINRIVPQLIKHGKIIRPGLGIGIAPANRYAEKGLIITYIDDKGAAKKAGLKGVTRDRYGRMYLGDILLKVDGKDVNSRDDIYQILDNFKVGDSVNITYVRDNKTKTTEIKLQSI